MKKENDMPTITEHDKLIALGRAVIKTEAAAVQGLMQRVDEGFANVCLQLLNCKGRTVVIGMGKSGHIAGKIAATMASTGTPAFFVHAGEAGHGDFGMITADDIIIALSNSGETDEIIKLLPVIKRLGVVLISITGNPDSALAQAATVNLDVSVAHEAGLLGLAPTASTTATLAMGDALAVALLEARGFSSEDFARSHPGGTLGRRLLIHVRDIMHTGTAIPTVYAGSLLSAALMEMTEKGLGVTAVIDTDNKLLGVFTDGDLRRSLDTGVDVHITDIESVMTAHCRTIHADALAAEALHMMEQHRINAIPVIDTGHTLTGILNMHDLLRARVV